MQAVISGQAGVALLLDGQELSSLHAETGKIVRRHEREIPFLLGSARDLQFLGDIQLPDIGRRLEIATDQADALHLTLILLDRELPHDVRRDAAGELASLLDLDEVQSYVENVLYSHPLPLEADLIGALSSCPGFADAARDLLLSLQRFQRAIDEVCSAWEQIPDRAFGDDTNRTSALAIAVREGFFKSLAQLRATDQPVKSFFLNGLRNPAFQHVRHHREILEQWLVPLREPRASTLPLQLPLERQERRAWEVRETDRPRRKEDGSDQGGSGEG